MSEIQEFFTNKTVLVTGATGFLGGVLLERLLSSCPGVSEVIVLARQRYGNTSAGRLRELLSLPLFDKLSEEAKRKVSIMTGDINAPVVGLCLSDLLRIKESVHVVFHLAADVNFTSPLDKAIITNLGGTSAVLSLAKRIKHLQALIYVSTAYCNCTVRNNIEEKVYPSSWDPVEFLYAVKKSPSELINESTKGYLKNHPNTHTFSKQLAENLIAGVGEDLPIAIVRPSIAQTAEEEAQFWEVHHASPSTASSDTSQRRLTKGARATYAQDMTGETILIQYSHSHAFIAVVSTADRPLKGWTHKLGKGPFDFIAGASRDVFKNVEARDDAIADLVPCDYLAAFLIATAWRTAGRWKLEVYHFTSGTVSPINWSEYVSCVTKYMGDLPIQKAVSPPRGDSIAADVPHKKVVDMLDKYTRRTSYTSSYFGLNHWSFETTNTMSLWDEMSNEDRQEFWFSMENFDWDSYIKTSVRQDSNNSIRAIFNHTRSKVGYCFAWILLSFLVASAINFRTFEFALCLVFVFMLYWL